MVDIETLSADINAAIISVGAVTFDLKDEFHEYISIQSCLDLGLEVSEKTLLWWIEESNNIEQIIKTKTAKPIQEVLQNFSNWLLKFNKNKTNIWSYGTTFDISILTNAYNKCSIEIPWRYNNVIDARSIKKFSKEFLNIDVDNLKLDEENKHNALADSMYQAIFINKLIEILRDKRNEN